MVTRTADGSAGDADYATIGQAYTRYRRPDPRIAARLAEALGPARTVLNVGAGAGSYEPADREVTPVEPSASMRAQRPAGLAAAVDATAENLPFDDGSFDAAMTTFSVHQWGDLRRGLREMRRVTRGPVLVLTCDPDLVRAFWLYEYAPEVLDTEARRYPSTADLADGFGGDVTIAQVPVPLDTTDGFNLLGLADPPHVPGLGVPGPALVPPPAARPVLPWFGARRAAARVRPLRSRRCWRHSARMARPDTSSRAPSGPASA
jgi:SAM-dependent methyltransferase